MTTRPRGMTPPRAACALLLLTSLFRAAPLSAQPEHEMRRLIPFQGHLTDDSGVAYDDTVTTLTFSFYDRPAGGAPLWTEEHPVSILGGLVNVLLGSVTRFEDPSASLGGAPASATKRFWSDFEQPLWLGVTLDAELEGAPRRPVLPDVFAFDALHARVADNGPQAPPVAVLTVSNLEPGKDTPWHAVHPAAGDLLRFDVSFSWLPVSSYQPTDPVDSDGHYDDPAGFHADRKELEFTYDLDGDGVFGEAGKDGFSAAGPDWKVENGVGWTGLTELDWTVSRTGTYLARVKIRRRGGDAAQASVAQILLKVSQ